MHQIKKIFRDWQLLMDFALKGSIISVLGWFNAIFIHPRMKQIL